MPQSAPARAVKLGEASVVGQEGGWRAQLGQRGGGMLVLRVVVRVHRVDRLARREEDAGWMVRV